MKISAVQCGEDSEDQCSALQCSAVQCGLGCENSDLARQKAKVRDGGR